ncbi:hypothetical protein L484_009869 [Morus notabilis]|uniref:Uncharacterized protein n=1 Tax=Morus notabilis TaxID=981085 RepID=W9R790_9ROSA|nr:hypothetical protein L484_009869 [Morus notabilis]
MLAGFLMPEDLKKQINSSWFKYVTDLKFFDQYPCGIECYNLTLTNLKQINFAESLILFGIIAFTHFIFFQFTVRPTLAPLTEKSEQDYYQGLYTHEDLRDRFIDRLTEFLAGDVILHSVVVEEEERRPSLIAPSPSPLTPSRSPPANRIHDTTSAAFTSLVAPQTHGPTFATSTLIGSQNHLHPPDHPSHPMSPPRHMA